ncbi:MAG: carboxypeptidase-like regulatory domain-containing protein, partial [Mucilaginibacter sp.]
GNLKELSVRLQGRTEGKVKRMIPWGPLSIAASILIVLGAGIWFFSGGGDQTPKPNRVAQEVQPETKSQPTLSSPSTLPATRVDTSMYAPKLSKAQAYNATDNKNKARDTTKVIGGSADMASVSPKPVADANADQGYGYSYNVKKDSVAANELAVNSQKKQANTIKLKEVTVAKAKHPVSTETLLQSEAAGVTVTTNKSITGVVVGDDGQPITGATVKIAGAGFGVVTDVNGKFTLPSVPGNATLAVGYIGYPTKKVKVANKDSLSISLGPGSSSLAEVVTTSKNVDDKTSVKPADAHPRYGWDAYDAYLKKNAVSADGKTGKVRVSFIVAADGSLSQFKIIKSLSDTADKTAISLITNGPSWVGGTDGKPKEVKVVVKFQ